MENVPDASCSASSLKLQRQQTQIIAKNVLIRSQSSGKLSRNEAGTTTTTAATTTTSSTSTRATARTLKIGAMQQKQLQPPNGVNTSNIILLRGTRNENGQIIIQNKQDILTLLNEQQQQQQQDKAAQASTAITLNQLPTTTTVARKTIVQSSGSTTSTSSTISIVASSSSSTSSSSGGGVGKDTVSNTILLQTPINASQLESVLKAQERTKQANGNQTKLIERPFLLKHASRSLSSESNGDGKSPFVLQTLKRLEKSQSILVIRNSTSGSTSSMTVSPPVNVSAATSSANVLSVTRTSKAAKGMAGALHKLKAAATAAAAARVGAGAGAGAGTVAAPSTSSTGTTILRLGKSATTLAINGTGGSKLEAATTTTSTANKLSNTVTSEQQQQQQQSTTAQTNVPLGNDGEPIKLPDNLESLPRADSFPSQRHRWNTNEEIAAILISFDKHCEWQSKEVRTRPKSGSLLLYSRKKVRYRRDGYCWKKRKDGKTTREDHMKLKVQGTECIYGCYVHSAILPTFHRRCYWLLQNPDIVLVHYLNVPYPDDNKMAVIAPSITLWGDKKEWTKEELVSQLKPMLSTVNSDDDSDSGNDIEISTAETVESIVCQLMEKQRLSRQAALVKQLDCGCGDSGCADGKTCTHPVMRRTGGIIKSVAATSASEKRLNEGAFSNGTPNVVVASKLYSRWAERPRQRNDGMHLDNPHAQFHNATQQLPQESAIKFQIIPPQQQQQQQQPQQTGHGDGSYQQQYRGNQMLAARSNLAMQQQQQQQYHQQQQQQQQHLSLQRFVASQSQNSAHLNQHHHRLQIANTTITATARDPSTTVVAAAAAAAEGGGSSSSVLNGMDTELIEIQSHMTANKISNSVSSNGNGNGNGSAKQLATQTNNELNVVNNNDPSNNNFMYNQQQQLNTSSNSNNSQQQQQHYYKLQQTSSATPNSGQQLQTQTQKQTQTQTPTLVHPPVEAMCMSPEHRLSSSSSGSSNNSNSNNNNNNTASTSSTVNGHSTPSTVVATTTSISVSTSSSCTSSTSSSLQSIIDGNQQQQITTTATAATCDNLMSANALTELSGGSSSNSNGNGNGNSNNQATDGHNKSQSQSQSQPQALSQNGCANFSASSDNSSQISASDESSSFGANNQNNSHSSHSSNSNSSEDEPQSGNAAETLSFFNETLDLSHEDIQRTLIANMQPYNTAAGEAATTTIEPLATSNSSNSNGHPQEVEKKPMHGHEVEAEAEEDETDDVFANLDAFDMLVEFPELDLDDKQALNNTALEQGSYLGQTATQAQQPRKIHNICDFSPEWSYTEGGVKVLVAGPWTSSNNAGAYTVLFDAQPVPTQMVQEGVLRCYCPAHEAGFVTLQVACGGFLVSNSVMFEYKLSLLADAPFDASSSNDCLYKFTLLNRLSTIDDKLQLKTEQEPTTDHTALYLEPNFEEKLVAYCHKLTKHAWSMPSTVASWSVGLRGMTLLHLAAALGYAKLVGAMLNWRAENPHIILETELDALSQDVYGFTPLAWSCVRGHVECSLLLYKWNHNALKIKTQGQQTPLDLANLKGHKHLLAQMFRLEKERCRKPHLRGGLANLSMNIAVETETEEPQQHQQIYNSFDLEILQRKHDGVFLRPGAVHSNQSPPNNGSRYSKRSSIDSGINMDIRSKSGKSLPRLHSNFEGHDNYALGVDSPLDTLTGTNSLLSPLRKMDFALCEVSTGESSPIHDKDIDGDDTSTSATDVTIGNDMAMALADAVVGDSDAKVLTLAEHIIAAMPERIKNEADEMMVLGSPLTEPLTSESSALTDSFMDPLLDSLPNTHFDSDFSFDFHDHSYRYHDVSTPCSSLSPASSGPLQSPASYSILGTDPSVSSPSPPPSTKQLTEFLHASSLSQYPFEADFSKLTLTDTEQRELYEAAKCIQKAYRSYKGRQKLEEQNKERTAAIVIQNYYRRYKQYAYYRQMTNAALVIQHGYRSYRRNKRFKKSGLGQGMAGGSDHGSVSSNSQCLSSFYDHYKQDQQQQHEMSSQPSTPKETSPSGPLKRTYSQSTQNQAARKIQQFMRQSRINIWDANLTTLTTERASRKREAGAPTQGGIPSKLAVSRAAGNLGLPRK